MAKAMKRMNFIQSPRSIATHRHSAIDDDLGAGDEARLVGSEKEHRVGGVASVAGEAERNPLYARLEQRLDVAAGALLREARFHHRRMELPRHHAIHADAFGRVL